MGHYSRIDKRIWMDEKFRTLDTMEKLAAIYTMTVSNRIGLFYMNPVTAADETGIGDQWDRVWDRVYHTLSWGWDPGVRVVFLPTWWRYNQPSNMSHFKGCLRDIETIPSTPLICEFLKENRYLDRVYHTILAGCTTPSIQGETPDRVYHTIPSGCTTPSRQGVTPIAIAKANTDTEEISSLRSDILAETNESSSAAAATEVPLLDFPCDGKQPRWLLTAEQVAEWSALFPSLDVLAECRSALAWVSAAPARRKTASGMKRFLVGWFGRAQNRGGNGHHRDQTGQRDRGAYVHPDDMYRDAKW